ncbi:GTP-dependent dephospho-CoA kinase [Thermococcus waiotapuensis]|uniref:GTP-dependent dephospho-CoA kinase n=1 Tax=Thermococcus waiotapuensis TaxID=90909 RepID=A0AAE4NX07_9EURY|nr:GTP-dependent dephospho-CoA kinase [Thermococcus waiotapuensis]MDV3103981.1 GTP-dependent dephospho-CoA kinase [Thermococcus waiotapuensis]
MSDFYFLLTPQLREELKEPLGELIRGEIPEPYLRIRDRIRGAFLVTVGDVVTENVLKLGIEPNLAVYDHRTKRRDYSPDVDSNAVVLTVKNPPGTVTKALLNALRRGVEIALRGRSVHVRVNGEEDLAAIPAVLYAPAGSVVLYGQPDEGVVLIKVTPECKRRCAGILARMEVVRNGD